MDWTDWKPHYTTIVDELDLDFDADMMATSLLDSMLDDQDVIPLLKKLASLIAGKDVVICGAGPSLYRHLQELNASESASEFVYVVADGAVSALLKMGRKCDILVTDLDGRSEDLHEAVKQGALPIVHAHGDNMDAIRRIVPILKPVLGSTQVQPTDKVFLWGGFTDGDRACHVVAAYDPKRVILAGMDFGDIVGPWSKPYHQGNYKAGIRKRKKLEIAERLIAELEGRLDLDFTLMR